MTDFQQAQQTDFQQKALTLAGQQESPAWLAALRFEGSEQWLNADWPSRRTELWKYTPLQALQKNTSATWSRVLPQGVGSASLLTVDALRLVFVNGVYDPEGSNVGIASADHTSVVRFSSANAEQRSLIEKHLGRIVNTQRHLFASLSNAWVQDGVLVHVPRNAVLEKPVYVVYVSTPESEPVIANHRLLVVLEDGAQAELIEHFVSDTQPQNSFVNALTEISIAANASLQHYRINLEQEQQIHIGGVHIDLQRDARYSGFTIAEGSTLKRIDYQINHRGNGAHASLNGVYLPRNNQIVDYHTNVEHWAPHCTTSEVFRGIIGDSARAVFNGRILIHPDAQKTLAELSNRNLLTSDKAEVDTKPELEIYADDVKCAHGATVSQLDQTAMYYLQSRGVSKALARTMLSFGFINELLQELPQVAVRNYLQHHLTELFHTGTALE
ncbi:MAG: Fe-S cluster assembly protein SufD [Gammaproteobacteria bacterium]|nr:Fe-S cluster assembly protein SufD [Gammaproteobacteria bacterium]MDP2140496.1 Fe-S cluster assembly protein SufD [Gammaproteobacteria bacterium]MDP2348805.1 Fe-S cluster assembly protein SufD [Gammaproteobacteria bacterium]